MNSFHLAPRTLSLWERRGQIILQDFNLLLRTLQLSKILASQLTVPDNLVTQKYDDSRFFLYFVDLGRYLHAQTELDKKLDI